jgi:cytochrome bd-type quinol oxidase subunit 2
MHRALSAFAIAAMLGGLFGAPLLVVWEWLRVRRGSAPMDRAARTGRLLVTAAVVCENLWWIPSVAYNHTSSGIAMGAWYAAIPLSFVALLLFFRVKDFVQQGAFWACWLNLATVAFLISITGE